MAVNISGKYLGQLDIESSHGPSGNQIKTTAPKDNGGTGEYFSPTDLMATSLGCCLVTIAGLWGNKHGFDLTGTTYELEKHMSEDLPRRIAHLPVTINIPASVVPEAKRAALEAAALKCPVKQSLHPDVKVEVTFNYV